MKHINHACEAGFLGVGTKSENLSQDSFFSQWGGILGKYNLDGFGDRDTLRVKFLTC